MSQHTLADTTTFALAFAALFLLLVLYLWRLERAARRLEQQVALLEASTSPKNDAPRGKEP